MDLSILLVNYNMSKMIHKFLPHIIKQAEAEGSYEIIILDNSDDPDFRLAQEFADANANIKLIFAENEGLVVALNRIIPEARYPRVVIMHPDVELAPGTLKQLHNFLDHNPEAGIVAPNLYYPNGVENNIRLAFPTIWSESRRIISMVMAIIAKRPVMRSEKLWDHKADAKSDMVMSVFMLFRKEALDQAYPINNEMWTYHANDYLCSEANKHGWQSWYVAGATAIHHERFSDASLYSSGKSSEYKRTPLPVSARMDRDRMIFESTRNSFACWQMLKLLLMTEYLIHATALSLKGKRDVATMMRGVIRKLWGMPYLHE